MSKNIGKNRNAWLKYGEAYNRYRLVGSFALLNALLLSGVTPRQSEQTMDQSSLSGILNGIVKIVGLKTKTSNMAYPCKMVK